MAEFIFETGNVKEVLIFLSPFLPRRKSITRQYFSALFTRPTQRESALCVVDYNIAFSFVQNHSKPTKAHLNTGKKFYSPICYYPLLIIVS